MEIEERFIMGNVIDSVFFDGDKNGIELKWVCWLCICNILMLECLVLMFGYVDKILLDVEGGFLV